MIGRSDQVRLARQLAETASASSSKLAPEFSRLFEVSEAEATGHFGEAARGYLGMARDYARNTAFDASTGISVLGSLGGLYSSAARCFARSTPPDLSSAIGALEESRARDLRAQRARAPARARAAGSAIDRIEAELSQLQAGLRGGDLSEKGGDVQAERAAIVARITELQRLLAREVDRVRAGDPEGYRRAALAPSLTLNEIQARLQRDEVLVYYDISMEQASAYVISHDAAHAVELPALDADGWPKLAYRINRHRASFRTVLRLARGLVLAPDSNRESAASAPDAGELSNLRRELHELLVQPLEPYVAPGQRVIVVPDGFTVDIPLSALGPEGKPWIARNPIRWVPAAFLLPKVPSHFSGGSALVVGDPRYSASNARASSRSSELPAEYAWQRLPGTRREADAVARAYGVKPYLDSQATEETVRALAPHVNVVHLATHGLANLREPAFSAVILANPSKGAREDGILYAYEVEQLPIRADLVVLSACETGQGAERGAEGMLALDRAFLVAGAGAVLSSMWVVDDESTAHVMRSFHDKLRAGAPADVALANAMKETMSQPAWRDPYYWAAFRLMGGGAR